MVYLPAGGSESTGDGEEDDLLAGGEGVDGDALELILVVEAGQGSIGYHVTNCNWSHLIVRSNI